MVSGETGCGKTTQIPQFVLDDCTKSGLANKTFIVCTQPHRIRAISIAERVAQERGENVGSSVGYQVRLDSKLPRDSGSILYCTAEVVLRWLRTNPKLFGVSHIILDEIHERDQMSDFLMAILKGF